MTIRNLGLGALVVASCVVCLVFLGCSDPNKPEQKPEDIVNPDKPSSNDRIISQAVIGDASKWSTLWEIKNDQADGYYFRGGYDDHYGVGRLTGAGDVTWFYRTGYSPRDFYALSQTSVVPNAILTVGSDDTDGDDESDIANVWLVSPSGSLLNQLVYSADTSDVWLNSIVHVADSTFLVVGGVRALAVEHPFIATIVLTSGGQLEKRHQTVVNTLPGRYFARPVLDPSLPAGSECSFFVASRSETDTYAIHKITVTWPSLTAWTIDWSRDIAVAGALNPWVYGLRFFDGNIYWMGSADDPAKEPRPEDGGYWDSAVAGSFTSTGQPRWATLVRVTGHSEGFSQFVAGAGSLYAMGSCGEFTQQDQDFGYGWICQLTTNTGSVVSNMTFGDHSYSSGFNDGILEGNMMHGVGWTREEVSGALQGWFCDVDISASAAESAPIVPARIGDDDQVITGDRPGGARGGR